MTLKLLYSESDKAYSFVESLSSNAARVLREFDSVGAPRFFCVDLLGSRYVFSSKLPLDGTGNGSIIGRTRKNSMSYVEVESGAKIKAVCDF